MRLIADAWRQNVLTTVMTLMNGYAISVTGFLLLRWLVGESWSVIALFNSVAHLLFLPGLVLLPVALLLRRRGTALLLMPALLAFCVGYGAMFIPHTAQAAADSVQMRVLTYNLKAQTQVMQPALEVIIAADADVVALQELSEEMAGYLAAELAQRYPYQALHTLPDNPIPGQGVLSRYPIADDEYWRIYQAMQRLTLNVAGQPVAFYNAHPVQPISANGFTRRAEEISHLLERTASETVPVLLAGDFNMSDQSADYWRIAARYQDAYQAAGWGLGFTFPATIPYFGGGQFAPAIFEWIPPLVRLDYVFHDAAFESLDAQVLADAGGSDHLPVMATLALR